MVSSEKETIMSDTKGTGQDFAACGWEGLDDRLLVGVADGGRGRWFGALALLAGFVALTIGVMSTGRVGTGESADMVNYHVPVIRTFAQELPTPNFAKYDSATTPGYHLVMALVWKATGMDAKWAQTPKAPVGAGPSSEWPAVQLIEAERGVWASFIHGLWTMQALNIVMSAGLLMAVYWLASRFIVWWAALALTLPLALNQYVLGASIWLTTDNVGWWLALSALAAAMLMNCPGGATRAGAWATAAVLVRQVHLWVCGPIFAAGLLVWLMGRRERGETHGRRALLATVVACAVPTVVVAVFVWMWGGLTPPSERIREVHGHGMNLAAVPFALSLLGAYGLAVFGAWRDQVGGLLRRPGVAVIAAGLGVIAALVVATTTQQPTLTDPPMRGYGWLWKLSGLFPAVMDRSILLVAGAAFGALVLVMLMRAAAARGNAREALILGIGLACWLAAQVVNPAAWQRYFDPIILAAVCWLAALGVPRGRQVSVAVGALVLAVMMSGLSFRSVWRDLSKNELPFDGGVLKMQGKLGEPSKAP
jgi:hypothetical protein